MKFISPDRKLADFLRLARVLGFLESSASKEDKVLEIKAARADGIISDVEALELAIEFVE